MKRIYLSLLLSGLLTLTACSEIASGPTPEPSPPSNFDHSRPRLEITEEAYFTPSLGFDAIRPIYQPTFTTNAEAPIEPDELIIGLTIDDSAKAYPLKVLRFREMVNDELEGYPILVSF